MTAVDIIYGAKRGCPQSPHHHGGQVIECANQREREREQERD